MFNGKQVLITGGTGSIGSELVRQIIAQSPKVIRIFSRDESKHFQLQQEFAGHDNVRYLVGDIREKDRLIYAAKDIDYIFHAAALKHVPSCEFNPFEAVKTNVLGTQNIIEAAIANEVEKVVSVSTDKVVNPVNTMGATKLLSEKIISAAEFYKGSSRTKFCCVRFGNVMGSRGSVIPLFIQQLKKGLPITLTHKEMTRFMMTIEEAAGLVLKAASMAGGGETFVLKMPVIRINDLAEVLLEDYLETGSAESHPGIIKIGMRPGEKLHEELMTLEESERAYENDLMFMIVPERNSKKSLQQDFSKSAKKPYASNGTEPLNKSQIKELLKNTSFI
ncbi:UDP-N-acetylglucosamine 4,6-dehydratase family protein [Falsibacillus pallidus]|uniref:UDP-N-acetylglucosamine 4,6-dehydratase family protein n=1 Tax=Falsibacillus pallidus TaxID=493781 RepID=UPI003D96AD72